MSTSPPTTLWLGMEEGRWPIYAFASRDHATVWMEDKHTNVARIWRVTISDLVEHELLRPTEARLRPKVPKEGT